MDEQGDRKDFGAREPRLHALAPQRGRLPLMKTESRHRGLAQGHLFLIFLFFLFSGCLCALEKVTLSRKVRPGGEAEQWVWDVDVPPLQ